MRTLRDNFIGFCGYTGRPGSVCTLPCLRIRTYVMAVFAVDDLCVLFELGRDLGWDFEFVYLPLEGQCIDFDRGLRFANACNYYDYVIVYDVQADGVIVFRRYEHLNDAVTRNV
uniref:Gp53.1 n=1 Tax=Caviid herpesvirus 2 str. CIDMTR TaxID=1415526 RepID=U6HC27_9BETA|nr:gp53.1 [Caviid herpesvirus 2 str. CIDMTR]